MPGGVHEHDLAPVGAEGRAEGLGEAGVARLGEGDLLQPARLGLGRPELPAVTPHQLLAREARDGAIRAIGVYDALRVAVDDADGVGGLVQHGAEAGALGAHPELLGDRMEEPRHDPEAHHAGDKVGLPHVAESLEAAPADEGEGEHGQRVGGAAEGERVACPEAAVAPRPLPDEHRHDRRPRQREDAGGRAGAAEAIDDARAGGDEGGGRALEEADQGHRHEAGVDVDAGRDLDARDHRRDGEGTEGESVHHRARRPRPRPLAPQPPVGIGVEEQTDDEDADGFQEVVEVHPVRVPRPLGRGSTSRRYLPV